MLTDQGRGDLAFFWATSPKVKRKKDSNRSDPCKSDPHLITAPLLSSLHQVRHSPTLSGFLKYSFILPLAQILPAFLSMRGKSSFGQSCPSASLPCQESLHSSLLTSQWLNKSCHPKSLPYPEPILFFVLLFHSFSHHHDIIPPEVKQPLLMASSVLFFFSSKSLKKYLFTFTLLNKCVISM